MAAEPSGRFFRPSIKIYVLSPPIAVNYMVFDAFLSILTMFLTIYNHLLVADESISDPKASVLTLQFKAKFNSFEITQARSTYAFAHINFLLQNHCGSLILNLSSWHRIIHLVFIIASHCAAIIMDKLKTCAVFVKRLPYPTRSYYQYDECCTWFHT